MPFVARMIAKQLLQLHNDHKIDLNNCIFIGFSLGVHVMGLAARMLKEVVFVPAIVALDPTKSLFSKERELERLCKRDAKYIEAIHTSTKRLGFQDALWDVDVYVNGGRFRGVRFRVSGGGCVRFFCMGFYDSFWFSSYQLHLYTKFGVIFHRWVLQHLQNGERRDVIALQLCGSIKRHSRRLLRPSRRKLLHDDNSSLGYIYTRPLIDESSATHGAFYVTNASELDRTRTSVTSTARFWTPVFQFTTLQMLFLNCTMGKSFIAPPTDANEGFKCVIPIATSMSPSPSNDGDQPMDD